MESGAFASDAPGPPDLLGLTGKVALVVGGGGIGLGRANCVRLAQAGCDVVVADLDEAAAKASAAAVEEMGRRAHVVLADAVEPADVERMVEAAVEHFGRLDVAVNSVGARGLRQTALLDIEDVEFDRVLALCTKSAFLCMKAEALAMVRLGRGGSIVNISSASAFVAADGFGIYGAGKSAMVHLTKTAATELARFGIRVNCVAPGAMAVGPPPTSEEGRRFRRDNERATVMQRIGTPEEVAGLTVFFSSQLATYVTGQTLIADGGQTLRVNRPQRDPEPRATRAFGASPLFDVPISGQAANESAS